jgi:hypothetical protein
LKARLSAPNKEDLRAKIGCPMEFSWIWYGIESFVLNVPEKVNDHKFSRPHFFPIHLQMLDPYNHTKSQCLKRTNHLRLVTVNLFCKRGFRRNCSTEPEINLKLIFNYSTSDIQSDRSQIREKWSYPSPAFSIASRRIKRAKAAGGCRVLITSAATGTGTDTALIIITHNSEFAWRGL